MGRKYVANFAAVAITAAQDLFEVAAPSTAPVIIHGWEVLQTSDLGDAAEEVLRVETVRGVGSTTTGSGGSTTSPQPIDDGDSAVGSTVKANNTTRMVAGSGSLENLEQHGWNVRVPMIMLYPPELRPVIKPSARWTLSVPTAPADSLTCSGTVWFEELS